MNVKWAYLVIRFSDGSKERRIAVKVRSSVKPICEKMCIRDRVRGMDIIFVTTAKTDEEARELLTLFNMPFQK